jgi:mannose-1-phosphate guanylyltransferase
LPTISACFEDDIKKFNVPEEIALVEEYFPDCPNISIDYGVMEKADNVYVLGVDFGWADLGTWGSVFDIASRSTPDNNAFLTKSRVLTYDTVNCIIGIDNPSNRLTVLQGLKDYIVVESGNVLLVCKKTEEHLIQKFISDAQIYFDDEYA